MLPLRALHHERRGHTSRSAASSVGNLGSTLGLRQGSEKWHERAATIDAREGSLRVDSSGSVTAPRTTGIGAEQSTFTAGTNG